MSVEDKRVNIIHALITATEEIVDNLATSDAEWQAFADYIATRAVEYAKRGERLMGFNPYLARKRWVRRWKRKYGIAYDTWYGFIVRHKLHRPGRRRPIPLPRARR